MTNAIQKGVCLHYEEIHLRIQDSKSEIMFDEDVTCYISKNKDEITVVIEKGNVFSTCAYYLNDDISYEENIYLILNSFLSFPLKKQSVKTIKLYRISADLKDYDNLDWIYKWNEGNIFFGTFLSYFFDYSKNEYVSYFFSKKDALKFIKKYNLTKEYLSEIEITTGNA